MERKFIFQKERRQRKLKAKKRKACPLVLASPTAGNPLIHAKMHLYLKYSMY